MKKMIPSVFDCTVRLKSHVFEMVLSFLLGSQWVDWNQNFVCEYLYVESCSVTETTLIR